MATTQLDLPPPASSAPPPQPTTPLPSPSRLGMPFDRRLLLSTFTAFTCGTFLGYTTTSRLAALRFRAENAHRLPISQPGWYLYHKSKTYYKLRHGVVAGLRSGAYLAAWSAVFFVIEESMDVFRGTWRAGRTLGEMEGVSELSVERMERGVEGCRDFWSSAVAGMVTGGLWSAWNGFPVVMAARTIRIGLVAGVVYGVGQDALSWARGRDGGVVNQAESWVYGGARNRRTGVEEVELEGKEQ
ncbi:hypothetical protein K458DRAFT_434763 [Lentithecium fluviatile CBS 122367]|uniref:Tim17-domain-containing protein n=1 Tax=Lentithecium fluviatile CBS 122367 TaxID=1168545 RepID=A0A6G1IPR5_9PLEO|nr:hypothetical protein K458DRAFT_434763 [Lentithecium fluviatile CBS 122367]